MKIYFFFQKMQTNFEYVIDIDNNAFRLHARKHENKYYTVRKRPKSNDRTYLFETAHC